MSRPSWIQCYTGYLLVLRHKGWWKGQVAYFVRRSAVLHQSSLTTSGFRHKFVNTLYRFNHCPFYLTLSLILCLPKACSSLTGHMLLLGAGRRPESPGDIKIKHVYLHRSPGTQWVSLHLHQLFSSNVNCSKGGLGEDSGQIGAGNGPGGGGFWEQPCMPLS